MISRCGVSMNSTQSFVLYRAGLFGFFALTLTYFQCPPAFSEQNPDVTNPFITMPQLNAGTIFFDLWNVGKRASVYW